MRVSGHETFAIRDGWLHKGVDLLMNKPRLLVDQYAADWLGVGGNMAKSIRHWLVAAGLASIEQDAKVPGKKLFRITPIGNLIHERDRYFSEPGTWWAIHTNLVQLNQATAAWSWFFNLCGDTRFSRHHCLDQYQRHVAIQLKSKASPTTLQKDMSCMLASYAQEIPGRVEDAEEARDCPLTELGLLSHYRDSGTYHVNYSTKEIPPEILGYCLAGTYGADHEGAVTIHEAAKIDGGPGRCFALTGGTLLEVAQNAESKLRKGLLSVTSLGGERAVRFRQLPQIEWLKRHYDSLDR